MISDISNKLISASPAAKSEQLPEAPVSIRPASDTDTDTDTDSSVADDKAVKGELTQEITKVSEENFSEIVKNLNSLVQNIERELNFRVDNDSGKTIVTVLDSKTDKVIRQIPADHVLTISENIENLKGILFSAEV